MQERLELNLAAVTKRIAKACSKKTLKAIEEVGTFNTEVTPAYKGRSEVLSPQGKSLGISRSLYLIGDIIERDELVAELAKI